MLKFFCNKKWNYPNLCLQSFENTYQKAFIIKNYPDKGENYVWAKMIFQHCKSEKEELVK